MISDRGGRYGFVAVEAPGRKSGTPPPEGGRRDGWPPERRRPGALVKFWGSPSIRLYIPRVEIIADKLKPMETKQCTGCADIKPLDSFYRKAASRDGRAARCKACANAVVKAWEKRNPDKIRNRTYGWRERYPEKHQAITRRSQLKRKYNITVEQYDAQLKTQGGGCSICGVASPGGRWNSFHVDHDHSCCPGGDSCGKCLRGLLCGNCNAILGMASDNIATLLAAVAYLERGAHGFE